MSNDQAEQDFKRALAATLKAISGKAQAEVVFDSNHYGLSGDRVRLPAAIKDRSLAGLADNLALRMRFHDEALNARLSPQEPEAQAAFNTLEEARLEALGAQILPGIATNIGQSLIDGHLQATEKLLALRLAARIALMGEKSALQTTTPIDPLIDEVKQKLPADFFDQAKGALHDQQSFARLTRQALKALGYTAQSKQEPKDDPQDDQQAPDSDAQDSPAPAPEGLVEEENLEPQESADASQEEGEEARVEADQDHQENLSNGKAKARPKDIDAEKQTHSAGYKIYTTSFDEIVAAQDLCDLSELRLLRGLLDKKLDGLKSVITRLANRLQRKLMAQQQRGWDFDLEEGVLDSAKLSRIVANPTWPASYKREREADFRDTVVTLLIDNSGSMRGRPIAIAAMCVDIVARTLERCGVKVEILGFTTRAWKGGDARIAWSNSGAPSNPGRLNDVRHIIYKSADTPWRHARANLGLMLREGILKENIDGEALLWAQTRLQARPERRRILMIISDGAPMDDSTLNANDTDLLENHLRSVINWIETKTEIELLAIGIVHDVTRYYKRALTLTHVNDLGGALINQFTELFDKPRH